MSCNETRALTALTALPHCRTAFSQRLPKRVDAVTGQAFFAPSSLRRVKNQAHRAAGGRILRGSRHPPLNRWAALELINHHPVADLELLVEPLGDLVVAQLAATVRAACVALVGKILRVVDGHVAMVEDGVGHGRAFAKDL